MKINYENNLLVIQLPGGINYDSVEGSIFFYRPSDASQDFSVPVIPDSVGTQYLNLARLTKGKWKATVDWLYGQYTYMDKKDIYIQ